MADNPGGPNLAGELGAIWSRHAHVQKDGMIFLPLQTRGRFGTAG